ncbi:MAG: hypothetical protein AAF288_01275 [Planctomycetota bacterium]
MRSTRQPARPFVLAFAGLFLAGLLAGCPTAPPTTQGDLSIPDAPPPSYAELAERYNRRAANLSAFTAYATVKLDWTERDEDGALRDRHEFGDARLIFRGPLDVALTVEKVGKLLLWAGSDGERFWVIDAASGDERVAHVGAVAVAAGPGADPLRLSAASAPDLLGMRPLPPVGTPPEAGPDLGPTPVVEAVPGGYRFTRPDDAVRITVDAESLAPVVVEVLDAAGWPIVRSDLSGNVTAQVERVDPSRWPSLPKTATVRPVGPDGTPDGSRMELVIARIAVPSTSKPLRDDWFDFDALTRALRVDDVVDLDQPQD